MSLAEAFAVSVRESGAITARGCIATLLTPDDEDLPAWVPVAGRLTVVESSDLAENLGLVPLGSATRRGANPSPKSWPTVESKDPDVEKFINVVGFGRYSITPYELEREVRGEKQKLFNPDGVGVKKKKKKKKEREEEAEREEVAGPLHPSTSAVRVASVWSRCAVRSFVVGSALLALAGCERSSGVAQKEPPASPSALPRTPSVTAAPPATASSGAPADASRSTPVPNVPPSRVGISGSTHATIACGARRCDAKRNESCVLSGGTWTCVVGSGATNAPIWLPCDDASDCRLPDRQLDPTPSAMEGFTCCRAPESPSSTMCNARHGVDTDPCSFEVCNNEEGAAACPKGQTCQDDVCRPAVPARATCAQGAPCPAATPVCRWEKDGGTCVTRAEEKKLREAIVAQPDKKTLPSAFACTKRSDCGVGQSCCLDRTQQIADCRLSCDDRFVEDVCTSDADCPDFFATGAGGGSRRRHCKPRPQRPTFPKWLGKCE